MIFESFFSGDTLQKFLFLMSEVCLSVVHSHTEDGFRQILAACYLAVFDCCLRWRTFSIGTLRKGMYVIKGICMFNLEENRFSGICFYNFIAFFQNYCTFVCFYLWGFITSICSCFIGICLTVRLKKTLVHIGKIQKSNT